MSDSAMFGDLVGLISTTARHGWVGCLASSLANSGYGVLVMGYDSRSHYIGRLVTRAKSVASWVLCV